MTDRPIIFSGSMVRALLDGRKTQTRRVLKPQPGKNPSGLWVWPPYGYAITRRTWRGFCQTDDDGIKQWFSCDHKALEVLPGRIGDRLWAREAWAVGACADGFSPMEIAPSFWNRETGGVMYRAGRETAWPKGFPLGRWRPSIHMPRWASRLTLTVTDVRVQRVQEISDADAEAEGAFRRSRIGDDPTHDVWTMTGEGWRHSDPRGAFRAYWDSINAKRGFGWDVNPWVVALTFTRT